MWRRPVVGTLLWVGLAVVIAVALFGAVVGLLLQASGWTAFHQASGSMLPTLLIGDRFFVDRDAYDEGRRPQRGDIIVFAAPARAPAAAVRNASNALLVCRVPGADIVGRANYLYWSGLERLGRIGLALK